MRFKQIVIVMLSGAGVLHGQQAEPILADFEDVLRLDPGFVLRTRDGFEYAQMRWHGVMVVDAEDPVAKGLPTSGYRTGRVSGRYLAVAAHRAVDYSAIRPIDEEQRFDLLSASFTSVWRNGLEMRLEGLRDGAVVFARELQLDTTQPTFVEPAFTGIDELRISTSGGADAGACRSPNCRSGPEVAIDDMRYVLGADQLTGLAPAPAIEVAEAPPPAPPPVEPEPEPKPLPAPNQTAPDPPPAKRAERKAPLGPSEPTETIPPAARSPSSECAATSTTASNSARSATATTLSV